jgi:hypothetical protein
VCQVNPWSRTRGSCTLGDDFRHAVEVGFASPFAPPPAGRSPQQRSRSIHDQQPPLSETSRGRRAGQGRRRWYPTRPRGGSNPSPSALVMSQDIGIGPNPRLGFGPCVLGAGWSAGGLVGLGVSRTIWRRSSPLVAWITWMCRSWMRSRTWVRAWVPPEADLVEPAAVAEGDFAGGVDDVAADPVMGGDGGAGGGGLGSGGVGDAGGSAEGAVWAVVVVVLGEGVQLGLQLGQGCGEGLAGQPSLQCLVEAFDAPMFVKRRRPGSWRAWLAGVGVLSTGSYEVRAPTGLVAAAIREWRGGRRSPQHSTCGLSSTQTRPTASGRAAVYRSGRETPARRWRDQPARASRCGTVPLGCLQRL